MNHFCARLFLLVWSTLALGCSGFQPTSGIQKVHLTPASPPSKLASSEVLQPQTTSMGDDDEECRIPELLNGPATVFGRAVDAETSAWNKKFIRTCKSLLFDTIFQGTSITRAYARFYALENIARMPYFSYLSVLHLYESLGKWRKAEYLKVHFSESWNEQHHLLIMEELGGSQRFADRFVAQHVAFFYYWTVIGLYIYNPTLAYNLNEAVEEEAFETYSNFVADNKEYLETQPAPDAAVKYYTSDDMYLFDTMHFDAEGTREIRRPKMENLLDAFSAVRDDEAEHVKTMAYLQDHACR